MLQMHGCSINKHMVDEVKQREKETELQMQRPQDGPGRLPHGHTAQAAQQAADRLLCQGLCPAQGIIAAESYVSHQCVIRCHRRTSSHLYVCDWHSILERACSGS